MVKNDWVQAAADTRWGRGRGGRVLIIVFNGAQNIKPTNSLRPLSSRGAVTEDDGGGGGPRRRVTDGCSAQWPQTINILVPE